MANFRRGLSAVAILVPLGCQTIPLAPPPPVRDVTPRAATPATPQRINVGRDIQWSYPGPAAYWVNSPGLSEAELEAAERTIQANADDLCARGRIIAFYRYDRPEARRIAGLTRFEHLLWMVRNHPEWDGFSVEPVFNRGNGARWGQASSDLLKEAWLQHANNASSNALVLHNAAMFFAFREPSTAADLLQRAIQLEPAERFYIERLGLVYAYAQISPEGLKRFAVIATPERDAFADRARYELLHSTDWVLVRGAVDALGFNSCGTCSLDPSFTSKLKELRQRADLLPADRNQEIPSELRRTLGRACGTEGARRR